METAKAFHYKVGEWYGEEPIYRAMAIAHMIEHGKREGMDAEAIMDEAKGGGKRKMNPTDAIFKRWSGE